VIDADGRVVHELTLPHPRAAVFEFFVDPERLVRWLGISAQLEPVPGGRFRFEVQPGQYCEGAYVEVDPPARVVFSWGWTDPWWDLPPGTSMVEVDLTEAGEETRLRLVHDRLPGQLRALHDEGWATFLARLATVTTGGDPVPHPQGDPASRQAALRPSHGSQGRTR
jgi:uncharacterized protein YndB with AHSA1/START domain